jgi:hypothetical protein
LKQRRADSYAGSPGASTAPASERRNSTRLSFTAGLEAINSLTESPILARI